VIEFTVRGVKVYIGLIDYEHLVSVGVWFLTKAILEATDWVSDNFYWLLPKIASLNSNEDFDFVSVEPAGLLLLITLGVDGARQCLLVLREWLLLGTVFSDDCS